MTKKVISKSVASISPSATEETSFLANKLKSQGIDIISFAQGEPDFDTPDNIKRVSNMSIYIDEKICKGCGLCVQICPNNVFQMRNKVNDKGFIIPEVINENKCIKCKLCELTCPDLAIFLE